MNMERLNLDKVKIMAAAATLAMFAGTACAHLEVYGQVNKEYLQVWGDDTIDAGVFADNNYSPSKLGVMSSAHLNKCWTFGGVAEFEFIPNNSRWVSQLQEEDPETRIVFVRKLDAWASYGSWGKVRLGLGEAATYGITDLSFAGTHETSLGAVVANMAGGMYFSGEGVNNGNPTVFSPRVRHVFQALNGVGDVNDYTGIMNTENRIRLDSGEWCGLSASVSYGNVQHKLYLTNSISPFNATVNSPVDEALVAGIPTRMNYFDVAVRYHGCWDDFKYAAAAGGGWYNRDGVNTNLDGSVTGATEDGEEFWSGSIAVEHTPSGFNAAVAGGQKFKVLSALKDYGFWYVQLGKHFCFTHYGKTHVAIDYFGSYNSRVNNDKGHSYALGITQDLNKINTHLYAGVRAYQYDDVPGVDYGSLVAASFGVLFKFGAML